LISTQTQNILFLVPGWSYASSTRQGQPAHPGPRQPSDLFRYSAYWPNIPAKISILNILAEEFCDGDLGQAVQLAFELNYDTSELTGY